MRYSGDLVEVKISEKLPVRLIILADFGGIYAGSFINSQIDVAKEANERGWEVEFVFSPIARNRAWLTSLPSWKISFIEPQDVSASNLKISSAQRTILHSHFSSFDLRISEIARGRENVDAFWHLHSFLRNNPTAIIRNILKFTFFARGVTSIICASDYLNASVKRRLCRKSISLPNGLDVTKFSAERVRYLREISRRKLGVDDSLPVILHFGRGRHIKGLDLYIDALSLLTVDAHAFTVAEPSADLNETRLFGRRCRLKFLEPSTDVIEYFSAADLFVSSSRNEGFNYSALEAISCEIPVVLSDIPAHRPLGSAPGVAISGSAGKNLAKAIEESLTLRHSAQGGNDWVKANFGLSKWVQELFAIYD